MSNPVIGAAARRFTYAAERHREDDQLVDLLIAAETLFLTDVGTPQDKGELRYRLSLRGAYYIGLEGATRRQVFRQLRRYDARSVIVHGGTLDVELTRSIGGEPASVSEFVTSIETLLRAAIMRAVREYRADGGTIADWDGLILGA